MDDAGGFDVCGKLITCINDVYHQPSAGELSMCLCQQIQTVNNKIELGDDGLLLKVIRQVSDIVISQCGFAAALCVPNNTFAHAIVELLFDSLGGKQLRVTHDVLLYSIRFVHISDGVSEQEGQARFTE